MYYGCDLSYDKFLKINFRKFKKKFPTKLAKKLNFQNDDKTAVRITNEIIRYIKNYNPSLKNKLEIYSNLFIYTLKNLKNKIKKISQIET